MVGTVHKAIHRKHFSTKRCFKNRHKLNASASINWRIQRKPSEGQEIRVFYDSAYSVQKGRQQFKAIM